MCFGCEAVFNEEDDFSLFLMDNNLIKLYPVCEISHIIEAHIEKGCDPTIYWIIFTTSKNNNIGI